MANKDSDKDNLIDLDACSWNEADVPLHERGVSLKWLINFVKSIYDFENDPRRKKYFAKVKEYEQYEYQKKAAHHFSHVPEPEYQPYPSEPKLFEVTTRQFVSKYVAPLTEPIKAPLYVRVPKSQRGKPKVFLSHAWDAKIRAVIPITGWQKSNGTGTLDAFNSGPYNKEDFVWIDFVCYNQHKINDKRIAFDMEDLIKSIGNVKFAITPVPLFNRIWCLWELLSIARNNANYHFSTAMMHFTEFKAMKNEFFESFTSVSDAESTKDSDYEKIIDAMRSHFGSIMDADSYIRQLMQCDMEKFLYSHNK